MSKNPVYTAIFWNSFIKKSLKYITNPDFIQIRYEDLISDLSKQFESIIMSYSLASFDFISSKDDLFDRLPYKHKFIHKYIILPPQKDSVISWQTGLTQKVTKMIEIISRKFLKHLDYNLTYCLVKFYPIIFFEIIISCINYYFRIFVKKSVFKILNVFH